MSTLLFFHVLVAMVAVGGLGAASVAAWFREWALARSAAAGALAAVIVAVGLGEGLAVVQGAAGAWLDASRGLALFGLLLGGAILVGLAGVAGSRPALERATRLTGTALVLFGLATAFVMAAKPS